MANLHYTDDKWYKTRMLLSFIAILLLITCVLNHSFNSANADKGQPIGEGDPKDILEIKREVKVIAEKKVVVVKKKRAKAMTLKVVPDKKEIPVVEEIVEVLDSNFVEVTDTNLLVENTEETGSEEVVETAAVVNTEPLLWSEIKPEFPGGEKALLKYLMRHLQYPWYEEENGMEGDVVATFVVHSDGSVGNIEIVRTTSDGFAREASKVLSKMPDWTPGYHNGQAVTVRYSLPVRFTL